MRGSDRPVVSRSTPPLGGLALLVCACGANHPGSDDEVPVTTGPTTTAEVTSEDSVTEPPPLQADPSIAIAARDEDRRTLVVGDEHTCAIHEGRVLCWGSNTEGQLGDGRTASRARPEPVSGLEAVDALAAGDDHTCALTRGAVRCWGRAAWDRATAPPRHPTPIAIAGIGDAAGIAAGGPTTCVRRADGQVLCFDGSGQLGAMALPASALAVQLGTSHGCARLQGGKMACWGSNSFGQIGSPDPNATQVVELPFDTVARIATGSGHSCALLRSGEVLCWGDHRPDRRVDRSIGPPSRRADHASELVAGGSHTCITAAGNSQCREVVQERVWPGGARGRAISPEVALPEGTTDVALGTEHRCVRAAGRILCWGNSGAGQCGVTEAYLETPAAVSF